MKNLNDIVNYIKPKIIKCGFPKSSDGGLVVFHYLYMKDGTVYRTKDYLTDRFGVSLKEDFLYIREALDEYNSIGDDPNQ